ncbi:ferritin-like domain-containing protein [uncultured Shewanella sp.]|uniref:ferritin-like domain-containing protein n=1 Tax=uncultured Shewanella sp. TaxID=173975 RepID=UPI0026154232|nr:ferritin-like domain-containing protein [uncultured Shewanella sp.]
MTNILKDRSLADLLRLGAEIEQQFMCMYLYGAYSVKKRYVEGQFEDETSVDYLPPEHRPLLEEARRWVSNIYTVARQEMEHLALVNNLLRAIGEAPYFARDNLNTVTDNTQDHIFKWFPLSAEGGAGHVPFDPILKGGEADDFTLIPSCKEAHIKPKEFDFALTPFTKEAVRAWTCMEAPCLATLNKTPSLCANWCFTCCDPDEANRLDQGSYAGMISKLYEEILNRFKKLAADQYVVPSQDQVALLQQYDIYVFPVTDFVSAKQAIDLITTQGEGNHASIDYPSHYRRFFEIEKRYQEQPQLYWELLTNPSEEDIVNPTTRGLFILSNQAYELLLLILTALYALPQLPQQAPFLASALKQEAFSPIMTMIIRSLSELLVQLKVSHVSNKRVASNFDISQEVRALLVEPYCEPISSNSEVALKPDIGDINKLLERFNLFNQGLASVDLKDEDVANPLLISWARERLDYIKTNAQRIQVNLSRITQVGIYSLLDAG